MDIGLHYVACTNGVPLDTDGNGLPDWYEDANGNGTVDSGETSWTNVGANVWGNVLPIADAASRMPQMAVGTDHTAYVAWLEAGTPNSLQSCTVTNRGAGRGPSNTIHQLTATWAPNESWIRLLRSNTTTDTNDYFKAFQYPALGVNPDPNGTNRAKHLYVAYAGQGTQTNDRCDIFLVQSTNGGVTWTTDAMRVNTDTNAHDQWMPTLAVKPDGNQCPTTGSFGLTAAQTPTCRECLGISRMFVWRGCRGRSREIMIIPRHSNHCELLRNLPDAHETGISLPRWPKPLLGLRSSRHASRFRVPQLGLRRNGQGSQKASVRLDGKPARGGQLASRTLRGENAGFVEPGGWL